MSINVLFDLQNAEVDGTTDLVAATTLGSAVDDLGNVLPTSFIFSGDGIDLGFIDIQDMVDAIAAFRGPLRERVAASQRDRGVLLDDYYLNWLTGSGATTDIQGIFATVELRTIVSTVIDRSKEIFNRQTDDMNVAFQNISVGTVEERTVKPVLLPNGSRLVFGAVSATAQRREIALSITPLECGGGASIAGQRRILDGILG